MMIADAANPQTFALKCQNRFLNTGINILQHSAVKHILGNL